MTIAQKSFLESFVLGNVLLNRNFRNGDRLRERSAILDHRHWRLVYYNVNHFNVSCRSTRPSPSAPGRHNGYDHYYGVNDVVLAVGGKFLY